jgi:hypothetical protein
LNKTISLIIMIVGVSAFLFGSYISHQIAQKEIALTQAGEHWRRESLIGPVRRGAASQANKNKQQRLNEAWQKVAESETSADWLKATGAVLFIIGGGLFLYRHEKK